MDRFGKGLLVVGLALMAYGVWGIYQAELATDALRVTLSFNSAIDLPRTTGEQWVRMTALNWIALIAGLYAVLIGKNVGTAEA
jgi:hypothetical protein